MALGDAFWRGLLKQVKNVSGDVAHRGRAPRPPADGYRRGADVADLHVS
jgi:hypothetical protein